MRTTIDLDEALLSRLKETAARTGRTMAALVEDAVREMLARIDARPARRGRLKLPTSKGTGLMPGVDLWDTSGLLDVMDAPDR